MNRREIEDILFRNIPRISESGWVYCRENRYVEHVESGSYAVIVFENVIYPTNSRTISCQNLVLMRMDHKFCQKISAVYEQTKDVDGVVHINSLFEIHEFSASDSSLAFQYTGKVDGKRHDLRYKYEPRRIEKIKYGGWEPAHDSWVGGFEEI
ncbi:MAG: hypothetical protein WC794_02455 [Candidatus Doudnabacteria bacterium]|jgi:hypothetical protein